MYQLISFMILTYGAITVKPASFCYLSRHSLHPKNIFDLISAYTLCTLLFIKLVLRRFSRHQRRDAGQLDPVNPIVRQLVNY